MSQLGAGCVRLCSVGVPGRGASSGCPPRAPAVSAVAVSSSCSSSHQLGRGWACRLPASHVPAATSAARPNARAIRTVHMRARLPLL